MNKLLLLSSFLYGIINSVSMKNVGIISCMLTGHMHKLSDALYNRKWSRVDSLSSITIGGFFLGVLTSLLAFKRIGNTWGRLLGVAYAITLWKSDERGARRVRIEEDCVMNELGTACI